MDGDDQTIRRDVYILSPEERAALIKSYYNKGLRDARLHRKDSSPEPRENYMRDMYGASWPCVWSRSNRLDVARAILEDEFGPIPQDSWAEIVGLLCKDEQDDTDINWDAYPEWVAQVAERSNRTWEDEMSIINNEIQHSRRLLEQYRRQLVAYREWWRKVNGESNGR